MNTPDAGMVARALARFRVLRDTPTVRGTAGERLANTPGSSTDFHDFRAYVPGDDPRHVDWAALGRSDELVVRLYRAELDPGIDVVVDGSASMDLADGRKGALCRELATYLHASVREQGGKASVIEVGDELHSMPQAPELRLAGRSPRLFADPSAAPARTGLGRQVVLISDFQVHLPAHDLMRRLAARASSLWVVRLRGPWEADPPLGSRWTLVDAETGAEHAVHVNDKVRARYLQRTAAIREALLSSTAGLGARFIDLVADESLEEVLRRDLLPAGLVVPN